MGVFSNTPYQWRVFSTSGIIGERSDLDTFFFFFNSEENNIKAVVN